MPAPIDITGHRFGRLVAICRAGNKGSFTRWECLCDCGTTIVTFTNGLRSGHAKSCGCLKSELTVTRNRIHGYAGRGRTTTYHSWQAMIQRCTNPKNAAFRYYGARGVLVCDRWLKFANFLSDMGCRPEGTTIDRKNNNKGYYPGNCRWATRQQQDANKRPPRKRKSENENHNYPND